MTTKSIYNVDNPEHIFLKCAKCGDGIMMLTHRTAEDFEGFLCPACKFGVKRGKTIELSKETIERLTRHR